MSIGGRIKERRIALNLSQRELAEMIGYSNHSTIARIEAGKVDLPQSKIVHFAEVLQTSISFLMGWEEEKKADKDTDKDNMTIGSFFEYLRKQRKLSVSEFSEEVGLTEEEIRNYESSKKGIPVQIVKMLADYFDISLERLTTKQVKMKDIFAAFASTNEAYVQQMSVWVEVFGNERFDDEEFKKLIEYGKFLIYQRKHKDT